MREDWRRRALLGALFTSATLGLSACSGDESSGPAAQPTHSETPAATGTPGRTSDMPALVENRNEVSWLVKPDALFEADHYGAYIYDIPRLREKTPYMQGEPIKTLDLTPADLHPLGVEPDQLDSFVKIDGIIRSEAEVVLFFGSFDPSTRPSLEDGEIVSKSEYESHTLYRVRASRGDIGIAVGEHTIILASDTAAKGPVAAARAPIEASVGAVGSYQDVQSGFAAMAEALWDGAITVIGTHESYRNSVRTNPETTWGGSNGVGSSVRIGPQTSDIRVTILYPSVEEATSHREEVARRARKSDELYSSWTVQRGSVVVLTGKRATTELSV